ncbi:hypothetical protein V2G26_002292 [Clonostachys chloroleuca]
MAVGSTLRPALIHLWVLLCLPWALSIFLFDATLCLVPWTRPSRKWSLNQAIRMRVVRLLLLYWSVTKAGDRLHLRQGREKNRFEVIAPRPLGSYKGALADTAVQPMQLGMTWTPSRPPPASLVGPSMVVVLHFHGGGFVIGNGRDEDTGYLAQTLIRHMGCTHVCTPQYRLSSGKNGQFPAPIQDALTAYLCLLKTKGIPASQIILSGDSAGANIVLALVRYIHQYGQRDEIPPPKAITLWSPWVDVGGALEQDLTRSPNYKTDYLNRQFGKWGPRPSPHMARSIRRAHICRLYVIPSNSSQAFLCMKHGWLVHLDISEACPHDILLLGPRVGFGAEAEEVARRARDFLSKNVGVNLGGYNRKGAL